MEAADAHGTPEHGLEPLLGIAEITKILRISESGVYRLVKRGELRSVKVGARTRFEQAAVREFIAAQRRDGGATDHYPGPADEEAA